MDSGFLKLSRRVFRHRFWQKTRVFSEFEAWIDLLQSARYDETDTTEYIDELRITYGRGQLTASIRFLAARWGWGEQSVRTYLKRLRLDRSITSSSEQGLTVITISNYDAYNILANNRNKGNTATNTPNQHDNSEIQGELTQHLTQGQHSPSTNLKKEKKDLRIGEAKTKVFRRPKQKEVEEYCKRRGNCVDAQLFIDYYSARGWMLEQGEMRDWRAVIRIWEKRGNKPANLQKGESKPNIVSYQSKKKYDRF